MKIIAFSDLHGDTHSAEVIAEEIKKFDFVIARAVTIFPKLVKMIRKNISPISKNLFNNGLFCYKGGDLLPEIKQYIRDTQVYNISDFFHEPFFKTKKIVYLGLVN